MYNGIQPSVKTDIKKVAELDNEFRLVEALKALIARVDKLEQRVRALELTSPQPLEDKKLTRVGKWPPYILPIVSDGKIWSTYAIEEEIRVRYPNIPPFNHAGVQTACWKMGVDGILEKLGQGVYRLKK